MERTWERLGKVPNDLPRNDAGAQNQHPVTDDFRHHHTTPATPQTLCFALHWVPTYHRIIYAPCGHLARLATEPCNPTTRARTSTPPHLDRDISSPQIGTYPNNNVTPMKCQCERTLKSRSTRTTRTTRAPRLYVLPYPILALLPTRTYY